MNRTTTRILAGMTLATLLLAAAPLAMANHNAVITSHVNGDDIVRGATINFAAAKVHSSGQSCVLSTSYWTFGDGTHATAGLTTSHVYAPSVPLGLITVTFIGNWTVSGGGPSGSCQQRESSVTLELSPGPAVSVTVSPDGVTMSPETQLTFTAVAVDSFGNPAPVVWSSSCDPAGGSIDTSGNFTAPAGNADCTITATSGSESDSTLVEVRGPPVPVPQLATLFLVVAGLVVLVGVAMRRKA